jgi:polar amino acid transport system permease protein
VTTRVIAGVRDTVEAWLGRFSFRTKLTVVWALTFVLLAVIFAAFRFDTEFMLEWFPFLLGGVPLTLLISVLGIMLAVPLALVAALARLSKNPLLNGVSGFYISFIRGTPLIVQIFFIYLGLPQLASYAPEPVSRLLILGSVTSGVLALGINYGAYMAEIFRAGILSVGHGQVEAAHALGMTGWQTTRRIVLPQAVRVIIPPTGNEFIAMLKDSALVGIVGTQELFFRASKIGRQYFHSLETLVVAALLYWIITGILTYFQAKLERRLATGYVREQPHGH